VVDYLEDIAKRTKTTVARVLAENKLFGSGTSATSLKFALGSSALWVLLDRPCEPYPIEWRQVPRCSSASGGDGRDGPGAARCEPERIAAVGWASG
jgi:hypothetical protein